MIGHPKRTASELRRMIMIWRAAKAGLTLAMIILFLFVFGAILATFLVWDGAALNICVIAILCVFLVMQSFKTNATSYVDAGDRYMGQVIATGALFGWVISMVGEVS